MVGAVALVAGAVLAVLGSLLPLFEQVVSLASESSTYSMTLWGIEASFANRSTNEPLYGVPVVVAAVLLVIAAALVLAAPRLPAWIARPTSIVAIVAAALLTGSVWTMGQLVLMVTSTADRPDYIKTTVGAGTGALVLACVLALVGGLLVQRWPDGTSAAPEPEPVGAVVYRLPDDDVDTPPFGTPVSDDWDRGA
jgi:hypothetical protein